MKLFAIADTHFDHTNIIKYCNRPFANTHEMNKVLITNWNQIIEPDDRVLVVGDFCLGPRGRLSEILDQLKGHVGLIIGNHDRRGKSFYMEHFDWVANQLEFGRFIFTHYPIKGELPNNMINIYGHTHQTHQFCGLSIKNITKRWNCDRLCVSVEATDYKPVLIWEGKPGG